MIACDIKGKTIFVHYIKNVCKGDPVQAATLAVEMKITAVFVKAADGVTRYNMRRTLSGWKDDIMRPFIDALTARGVKVWGWHYIYGENIDAEIEMALTRLREHPYHGWIIDFEKEFENPDKAWMLERYFVALRAQHPTMQIGSTSSRYYKGHELLPWEVMMQHSDFYLPQVYWVAPTSYSPAQQLVRSYQQYREREAVYAVEPKPYIPVGACYHEDGWQPTYDQIIEFHNEVLNMKFPAESWWEWGGAQIYNLQGAIFNLNFSGDVPEIPGDLQALLERLDASEKNINALKSNVQSLQDWASGILYSKPL
jgi:hypothetical protein